MTDGGAPLRAVEMELKRRSPRVALDRGRITQCAFDQLEADGLSGLSMRSLAARLEVQAPALYWHFSGKDELLAAMADDIYSRARQTMPAVPDWRSWLLGYGTRLFETLCAHRDGALLCATASPSPSVVDAADFVSAPLVSLGLDAIDAISMQASVISLALGWAIYEQNQPMRRFLSKLMDPRESFNRGLNAIVAGFAPADTGNGGSLTLS